MLKYINQKLWYALTVILGVITVVFLIFNVLPSDTATLTMGQRADVASIEAAKKELGLDKSVGVRYLLYLNDLLPLTFHTADSATAAKYNYSSLVRFGANALVLKTPYMGRSYQSKKLVTSIIADSFPNTLVLAVAAMALAIVLGIIFGMLAASFSGSLLDKSLIYGSVLFVSIPSFFSAVIIAWLFAYLWADVTGLSLSGSLYTYNAFSGKTLAISNLILPAITLGIRPVSVITQLTRNQLVEVYTLDYIRTARAKGLSAMRILWVHALPNALNPVITAVSGWFASLLAGAFFVEYIFGWNGLGNVTVAALEYNDFPVIIGAVIVIALIFVLVSIFTDILYAMVDPRIRK